MSEELLTTIEARKLLKCGHTHLYFLLNQKKIRAVKNSRKTLILRSSLDEFISGLPSYEGAVK